eukprot:TRINITY_DN1162_c0_g1_i6.p1 TRINITY_DN1162_c0_g1~~TRINITY_DN1162_c0_g1_i6.p1  ORF type:complete len:103 (+),score=20.13 TRINITY_DN1162_c0_g1_i6:121-429(+)
MMQYLGLIEEKTNELIAKYQAAAQSHGHPLHNHAVHVAAQPAPVVEHDSKQEVGDAGSPPPPDFDEEDDDVDSRPLTREELERRSIRNKNQRRKNKPKAAGV